MKQNLVSQTMFNSFAKTPKCRSHHWAFNLSHMPNLLDPNRITVVWVFDSVCTNVVRNPADYYDLGYVLATLGTIAIVVGLLHNMVSLQKNRH